MASGLVQLKMWSAFPTRTQGPHTKPMPTPPSCHRRRLQTGHQIPFTHTPTDHCPTWGSFPSTLTSAPRDGTPSSQQGWTAGVLRSGSRCLWPVALNQMLGVKRGEPQSSAYPRYRNRWEKGFPFPLNGTTKLAPHRLPESAGFAPDPPLLPLPQLRRPPGAKSWLLESINPG